MDVPVGPSLLYYLRVSGEWPETKRGFGPCFDVHARMEPGNNALPNVESGAWVGAGPIIHHHYEMLATLF